MIKFNFLSYIKEHTFNAFLKFPSVCLFAIACTFLAFYYVNIGVRFDNFTTIYTLILAFPLYFAAEVFAENNYKSSKPAKLFIYFVCGLFLLFFNSVVVSDGTNNFYTKVFQIFFIVHLLVAIVLFSNNERDKYFWSYNYILFHRFIHSGIFAFVFYIGLVVAKITIESLFNLKISKDFYLYLFSFSSLFLSTWFFLAGVPKKLKNFAKFGLETNKVPTLIQFLLVPLVFLYICILYIYLSKVLITQVWPNGYVGWLVIAVSVLGVLVLLLLDQYKTKHLWITKLTKIYYVTIIPLLAMLFIAIYKRIHQYGLTEKRYFLLVLGATLLFLSIYFIFSKKKSIKLIPISLFIVSSITLTGPWSAYTMSKNSQTQRMNQLLATKGFLNNGKIVPQNINIPYKELLQIKNIFRYLLRNHGKDSFTIWFPQTVINKIGHGVGNHHYSYRDYSKSRNQSIKPLLDYLNISSDTSGSNRSVRKRNIRFSSINEEMEKALDISTYSSYFDINFYDFSTHEINGTLFELDKQLLLTVQLKNGNEVKFDLKSKTKQLEKLKTVNYEHHQIKQYSNNKEYLLILDDVYIIQTMSKEPFYTIKHLRIQFFEKD